MASPGDRDLAAKPEQQPAKHNPDAPEPLSLASIAIPLVPADQPVTAGPADKPAATQTQFSRDDVRKFVSDEVTGTDAKVASAESAMTDINNLVLKGQLQVGSDQYKTAVNKAIDAYVGAFQKAQDGTAFLPGGMRQGLAAADSAMRQFNLAVEGGMAKDDPLCAKLLALATSTYKATIEHAQGDSTDTDTAKLVADEGAKLAKDKDTLNQAIQGNRALTDKEKTDLGIKADDPRAGDVNGLKALLQERTQDQMTLNDYQRSLGYANANFGLALLRSSAKLTGEDKDKQVALGVDYLNAAQAADSQTFADANFRKHLGAILDTVKPTQASMAKLDLNAKPTEAPAAPRATIDPKTFLEALAKAPAQIESDAFSGSNRYWQRDVSAAWQPGNEKDVNPKFREQDPRLLMSQALNDYRAHPQGPTWALWDAAKKAADSVDRKQLRADLEKLQGYKDQALSGPNGQLLKDKLAARDKDLQQMKDLNLEYLQKEDTLEKGLNQSNPADKQLPGFVDELKRVAQTEGPAGVKRKLEDNKALENALFNSDNGKALVNPDGRSGVIDRIAAAKADLDSVYADMDRADADAAKQNRPTLHQILDIAAQDQSLYASSISVRSLYLNVMLDDLASNKSLTNAQQDDLFARSKTTITEIAQLDPTQLSDRNFLERIKLVGETPLQVAQQAGIKVTEAQPAAPIPPEKPPLEKQEPAPAPAAKQVSEKADAAQIDRSLEAGQAQDLLKQIKSEPGGKMTDAEKAQFEKLIAAAESPEQKQKDDSKRAELDALSKKLLEDAKAGPLGKFLPALAITDPSDASKTKPLDATTISDLSKQIFQAKQEAADRMAKAGLKTEEVDNWRQLALQGNEDAKKKLHDGTADQKAYANASAASELIKPQLDQLNAAEAQYQDLHYNAAMVRGLYGVALYNSGDVTSAAKYLSAAGTDGYVNHRLPVVVDALTALSGVTTAPPAQHAAAPPTVERASVPLDQASALPPDAQSAPDFKAQLTARINKEAPAIAMLDRAEQAFGTDQSDAIKGLKAAQVDYEGAILAADKELDAKDAQSYSDTGTRLKTLNQEIETLKSAVADGSVVGDPDVQMRTKLQEFGDLSVNQKLLEQKLGMPINARFAYAVALDKAADQAYKMANQEADADKKAALTSQADEWNAKALSQLQAIPANLPGYPKELVDGAIKMVQGHQLIDENAAKALGYLQRAQSGVDDAVNRFTFASMSFSSSVVQPLAVATNLVDSVPWINSGLNFVNNYVAMFPVPTSKLDAPTDIPDDQRLPSDDTNHRTTISQAELTARYLAEASVHDQAATEAQFAQTQNSLGNTVKNGALDLLGGPGGWMLASKLAAKVPIPGPAPVKLAVRAIAGLALDGFITKTGDLTSHALFGTDRLTDAQLKSHVLASYGSTLAVGGLARLRSSSFELLARRAGMAPDVAEQNAMAALKQRFGGRIETSIADAAGVTTTKAPATLDEALYNVGTSRSAGFWKSLGSLAHPGNLFKGAAQIPFKGALRGAAESSESAMRARAFYSSLVPTAVGGGIFYGGTAFGDMNPWLQDKSGKYYSWDDSLSNAGVRFGTGFAAAGATRMAWPVLKYAVGNGILHIGDSAITKVGQWTRLADTPLGTFAGDLKQSTLKFGSAMHEGWLQPRLSLGQIQSTGALAPTFARVLGGALIPAAAATEAAREKLQLNSDAMQRVAQLAEEKKAVLAKKEAERKRQAQQDDPDSRRHAQND